MNKLYEFDIKHISQRTSFISFHLVEFYTYKSVYTLVEVYTFLRPIRRLPSRLHSNDDIAGLCAIDFVNDKRKGPFIATQLNSTQLDVELSSVG